MCKCINSNCRPRPAFSVGVWMQEFHAVINAAAKKSATTQRKISPLIMFTHYYAHTVSLITVLVDVMHF